MVKFIAYNTIGNVDPYLTLAASGVVPGTYTASSKIKIQREAYDGTILTCTPNNGIVAVNVVDPTTLNNKLPLQTTVRPYNTAISPDLFIQNPAFHMYNSSPLPKKNQVMEYTIGTGYEVIMIAFPTTNGQAPTNVIWETRSGLTGTASNTQIVKGNPDRLRDRQ
jgi:hypothetical protein